MKARILLVLIFFSPSFAAAQPLTIEQALERVDQIEALERANDAEVAVVEARAAQASRWSGPEAEFEWSSVDERESEFEATLRHPIPIDGSPGLTRKALEREVEARRFDAGARLQSYKGEVAETFYGALFRVERLSVLSERAAAVERTRGFLEKRRAAGDVAVYEVERLDREVRRLTLRMERQQAEIARDVGRLRALLQDEIASVEGELAVESCGGTAELAPRVASLEAMAAAATVRVDVAERTWVPELAVGAGYILSVNPLDEVAHGYRVLFSLGLPLWQSSELAADEAEAEVVALRAEAELERRRIDQLASASRQRCEAMKANASAVEASIPKTRRMLERAESGYSAGELSLLELLDAQEAVLEDRLDLLEAEWSARRSQIEWMTTTGSW